MSLFLYPTINPSRLFFWLVHQLFRGSVAFFKIDIGPFHLFMIIENSKSQISGYIWRAHCTCCMKCPQIIREKNSSQIYIYCYCPQNTVERICRRQMPLENVNKWHYVLRALKTSRFCSRRQTYVFQSKIAQGIQKWVQNNQLSSLLSNVFFKKLFLAPKIIKKIGCFIDLWIFMWIYVDKLDQF